MTAAQPTRGSMTRKALSVAWPAVVESFFIVLAGMIDTMMVAELGPYAVAATGLTAQPKFIGLTVFFGVNIAVSALVARRKGERNQEDANEITLTALWLTVALCAVLTAVFVIFTPQMMRLAGSNEDTHEAAVEYFRIIMGGLFFNVITMVINAAQRGSGNTKLSMYTNLVSSIVNIIFNWLLIKGRLGFPAWGIRGAAIATVLGTVVSAGMAVFSLFRRTSYVRIPLMVSLKSRFTKRACRSIWTLAASSTVENLAMRIGFLATAMIAARLGTDEFAAHNIGMNLLGLGFSFADGMQVAAIALTGESLGAGEKEKARQQAGICQRIGFFISLVLSVILLFGGRWIFSFYFKEDHILDMGVLICRFMTVIILLQISQIIFTGTLRAAGDVHYTLVVALISVTFIRTVVTFLLVVVFKLGLTGVWIGILSDQCSRFCFMGHRFRQGKWVNLRI